MNTEKTAYKVSTVTIIGNLILSVFKFAAGIIASSSAMISDAIHSASDLLSTFIVITGVKISGKKSDKNHPYGHERFECVCAVILAVILCMTGIGIGASGIKTIFGDENSIQTPGVFALVAAVISISAKEVMYQYTAKAAKKINSSALMADAWHHRSDALSSIGSLVGIGGAMLGIKILDPIASVLICVFIVKAAYDIFKDAVEKMTDQACDDATEEELRKIISEQAGVMSVDMLKTRMFGNKIYVDVEIGADKNLTLEKAHMIAEATHHAIEAYSPNVKHCMVHVNPK